MNEEKLQTYAELKAENEKMREELEELSSPSPKVEALVENGGWQQSTMRDLFEQLLYAADDSDWDYKWSSGQVNDLIEQCKAILNHTKPEMMNPLNGLQAGAGLPTPPSEILRSTDASANQKSGSSQA